MIHNLNNSFLYLIIYNSDTMFSSKKPKEKVYSGYLNFNQDGRVIVPPSSLKLWKISGIL